MPTSPPSSATAPLPKPTARRDFDALLLFIAGLALIAELALLLQQMRLISFPLPWDRGVASGEIIGEVISKKRALKHRAASSLTWYPMIDGDRIHMDDTLMTGAESTATLQLKTVGELTLEPFTLIRFGVTKLAASDGPFRLELNQGTVKVRSSVAGVRVQVRDREISMKPESEITVTTAALATQSEVLVTKGQASIQSDAATDLPATVMNEGDAFNLSPERGIARVETQLRAKLLAPQPEMRFVASQETLPVVFKWEGDQAESVEWATDRSFRTPALVSVKGSEAKADLKPGRYFWRLRKAIALSPVSEFLVLPNPGYRAMEPKPASTVKTDSKVALQWAAVPGAKEYRLEISERQDFSKEFKSLEVDEPKAEVAGFKAGKYYWRVLAVHEDFGDWPASPTYAFQVKKKMTAPKLKGAKVLPAKKPEEEKKSKKENEEDSRRESPWAKGLARIWDWIVPSAHAESAPPPPAAWNPSMTLWLEFQWERTEGAVSYRLEISSNREFTKMLSRSKLSETSAIIELPDTERYYWRVAAIDEDDEQGPFSKIQEMKRERARVVPPPARKIAAEPPKPKEEPKPEEPKIPARFEFEEARFAYGAAYLMQSLSGADLTLSQSGLPLNRLHGSIRFGMKKSSLELGGWFQRLRSVAQNAEIVGLQPDLTTTIWGAELLWRDVFPTWAVGLRARGEADFLRAGSETAGASAKVYAGLGVGKTFRHAFFGIGGGGLSDLLVDVAPFGARRGVGLLARTRWAYTRGWGDFTPSLELSAYPNYRFGTGSGSKELGLEASFAVAIAWEPAPAAPSLPSFAPKTSVPPKAMKPASESRRQP